MIAFVKAHKVAIGVVGVLALLGGYAYAKSRKAAPARGTLLDPYPGVTATPWEKLFKGTIQILGGDEVTDDGQVIDSTGPRPAQTWEEMQ